MTAIAVLGGVALLLAISLCGCWLRSRAQVGLLGAVMSLGSVIASGVFWFGERMPMAQMVYGIFLPQSLVVHWAYSHEFGGGGYTDHELAPYRWLSLGLAVPVMTILAALFVYRYGSRSSAVPAEKRRRFRFGMPAIVSRLSINRPLQLPNRLIALIWLELRQSVPLAVFGLAFAMLTALASVLVESRENVVVVSVMTELPHTVFFVGMLWAVVVGSGLYSKDLEVNAGNFWRSRPISVTMWFWCKFVVGLLAVLIVLDGATILISWEAPRHSSGMSWAYIGCFPIIHAMMYSLAVLLTCVFRRPVIGGVLAVFVYFVTTTLIATFPATRRLDPISIQDELLTAERAATIDFSQHGYPLVYGTLVVLIVVFGILASRFSKPLQSFSWSKHAA